MAWGALTIVLQPEAQKTVDSAASKFGRFDDAYSALEWLLARKPDIGYKREDDNGAEWYVHVQAGDPVAAIPEIWVLYQRESHQVVIHAIEARQ